MAERSPALLGTLDSRPLTQEAPYRLLVTEVTVADALTSIAVRGELDMESAHLVTSAVEEGLLPRPRILILDLSAVTFCDCTGMRSLLRAGRRVAETGATFHLESASASVRRILDITGSAAALGVVPRAEVAPV